MSKPEYTCVKCGISISQEDIDSEKAAIINDKAYCPEHYRELVKKAALDTQIIEDEEGKAMEEEE